MLLLLFKQTKAPLTLLAGFLCLATLGAGLISLSLHTRYNQPIFLTAGGVKSGVDCKEGVVSSFDNTSIWTSKFENVLVNSSRGQVTIVNPTRLQTQVSSAGSSAQLQTTANFLGDFQAAITLDTLSGELTGSNEVDASFKLASSEGALTGFSLSYQKTANGGAYVLSSWSKDGVDLLKAPLTASANPFPVRLQLMRKGSIISAYATPNSNVADVVEQIKLIDITLPLEGVNMAFSSYNHGPETINTIAEWSDFKLTCPDV